MAMKVGIAAGAAVGVIAGLTGIYLLRTDESKVDQSDRGATVEPAPPAPAVPAGKVTRELAKGTLTAFVVKPNRVTVPDLVFTTEEGQQVSIEKWRGRVVLLNLWATWCAPCRKEMPSLAALQQQLGSDDFEVVAISVDRKGAEASAAFLIETGATALKLYVDKSAAVLDAAQAVGLPATLLIDRQGREIGRMLGPADWSSPEAIALIKAAIAEGKTS
jgi:thiol-disulfide isomerase/thioredoxin